MYVFRVNEMKVKADGKEKIREQGVIGRKKIRREKSLRVFSLSHLALPLVLITNFPPL